MPTTEEAQETEEQQETGTETEFGTDGQPFDATRAQALIAKLRGEAKQASKALREYEQLKSDRQKAEDEKLSEQERLAKQLIDLQSQLEQERKDKADRFLEYAIERQATKLGLVDPEAARLLLDKSQLEFDKEGKPSNVEGVLRDLVKTRPYLAGQQQQQQQQQTMNPTNPSRAGNQQQEKPVYTRAQFTDYKYYQAHRDEMMLAMKEGRVVDG